MKPVYDYDGETGVETQVAWELTFAELESLRTVARAAANQEGLCPGALSPNVTEALDALPAWVLEE